MAKKKQKEKVPQSQKVQAVRLEDIRSDLIMTEALFSSNDSIKSQALINKCAYHAVQAIEKTFKHYIKQGVYEGRIKRTPTIDDLMSSHNITKLSRVALKAQPYLDLNKTHAFVYENAPLLDKANNLRYSTRVISETDARSLFFCAKRMYEEADVIFRKENHLSVSQVQKAAKEGYKDISKKTDNDGRNIGKIELCY